MPVYTLRQLNHDTFEWDRSPIWVLPLVSYRRKRQWLLLLYQSILYSLVFVLFGFSCECGWQQSSDHRTVLMVFGDAATFLSLLSPSSFNISVIKEARDKWVVVSMLSPHTLWSTARFSWASLRTTLLGLLLIGFFLFICIANLGSLEEEIRERWGEEEKERKGDIWLT